LTTEWLFDVWPDLIAALYDGIVRIDTRAGVWTAIDITRTKHDFGEALHPTSFTGSFGADNVLHRIARWTCNDAAPAVCFNRSNEDSEF
jgi:hypothetical protein